MPLIEFAYFEWLASVHDHPPAEQEEAAVRRRVEPRLLARLCRRSSAPGKISEAPRGEAAPNCRCLRR